MSAPDLDIQNRTQQPMLASSRAKASNDSAAKSAGYFPLGYKEGFSQWWAGLSPALAEHRVLSFIPNLLQVPTHTKTGTIPSTTQDEPNPQADTAITDTADPHGARRWHSDLIPLSGKNRALNEFSVERIGEDVNHNLVMLHGYGAGLGFFYRNFDSLSRLPGWKLYALDMLGMGRSSRPTFKIHAKDRQAQITEAESWFVDSLEEWRIKKGIDRFTLLGHSLGGYMACAYALKYPGHLNKLVLASPVGIPEDPYAVNADMPSPGDSAVAKEFTDEALATTASSGSKDAPAPQPDSKPARRARSKWLTYLWDANVSPFSVVRLAGPLGPRLVSGWTSRRFNHLPEQEAQALHDYSYSLFRQRGSGEYALAYVLAPGAFARSPLIRRVQGVGRQFIEPHTSPQPDNAASTPLTPRANSAQSIEEGHQKQVHQRMKETGVPVVFLYGENDWMDVAGGFAAQEKMDRERDKALETATPEERAKENGSVKVVIVPKAGHHVYLDNSTFFNAAMTEELEDVERRERALGHVT